MNQRTREKLELLIARRKQLYQDYLKAIVSEDTKKSCDLKNQLDIVDNERAETLRKEKAWFTPHFKKGDYR